MTTEYDIVVYGATGFTGGLVCEYLARNEEIRPGRWAIAGRDESKLSAVRDGLKQIDPRLSDLPIIIASSDDAASLQAMAEGTRVVLTTVGPYARYGEPLVAACARAGTDYVDLTGEPGWWRDMIDRYHDEATRTGARIVPACGFDSIPFDLGVLFAANQLPSDEPVRISGYLAGNGTISGGTLTTMLGILSTPRSAPSGGGRPGGSAPVRRRRGMHRSRDVRAWVVPLPTIDPLIVKRSSRLVPTLDQVSYTHYAQTGSLLRTMLLGAGVGALYVFAQFGFTRRLVSSLRPPGTGATAEKRAKAWFRVKFTAETDSKRVITQVAGGDAGYDETSKMVAESALCLAYDDLSKNGGVLTTASAMGQPLIDRLIRAGLEFRVVD